MPTDYWIKFELVALNGLATRYKNQNSPWNASDPLTSTVYASSTQKIRSVIAMQENNKVANGRRHHKQLTSGEQFLIQKLHS
jgi:hypothetical protein